MSYPLLSNSEISSTCHSNRTSRHTIHNALLSRINAVNTIKNRDHETYRDGTEVHQIAQQLYRKRIINSEDTLCHGDSSSSNSFLKDEIKMPVRMRPSIFDDRKKAYQLIKLRERQERSLEKIRKVARLKEEQRCKELSNQLARKLSLQVAHLHAKNVNTGLHYEETKVTEYLQKAKKPNRVSNSNVKNLKPSATRNGIGKGVKTSQGSHCDFNSSSVVSTSSLKTNNSNTEKDANSKNSLHNESTDHHISMPSLYEENSSVKTPSTSDFKKVRYSYIAISYFHSGQKQLGIVGSIAMQGVATILVQTSATYRKY